MAWPVSGLVAWAVLGAVATLLSAPSLPLSLSPLHNAPRGFRLRLRGRGVGLWRAMRRDAAGRDIGRRPALSGLSIHPLSVHP